VAEEADLGDLSFGISRVLAFRVDYDQRIIVRGGSCRLASRSEARKFPTITSILPSLLKSQKAAPMLHFVNPFNVSGPLSPSDSVISLNVPSPLFR
jgi:hypothetical protein